MFICGAFALFGGWMGYIRFPWIRDEQRWLARKPHYFARYPRRITSYFGQLRKLDAQLFEQIPDGDLVVGFRNVLAHGYATLDHRRVYEIASARAGGLLMALGDMLAQMPEQPPMGPSTK
jgi:hypothetical protein